MQSFEIYNVEKDWKDCKDMRPWLIVEQRTCDIYVCFPISGECYNGYCFEVDADHADFTATGLTKTCFIHFESLVEMHVDEFQKQRGVVAGAMLDEFREIAGV